MERSLFSSENARGGELLHFRGGRDVDLGRRGDERPRQPRGACVSQEQSNFDGNSGGDRIPGCRPGGDMVGEETFLSIVQREIKMDS